MKKIALCFLITKDIRNFKVWQKWWKGYENRFTFYTHYSKNMEQRITNPYIKKNRVKPVPTKWGDISLVYAEQQLYKEAYKNKNNKFFILLSDTCIPVRPFMYTYRRLMKIPNRGIGPWSRLNKLTINDSSEDFQPFIKNKNCVKKMKKYKLINHYLYTMDQWKILSRKNLRDFFEMLRNKEYIKIFKICIKVIPDSLAPDELMYINYLHYKYNNLRKQIRPRVVTYVDFKGKAIHPITYKTISNSLKRDLCDVNVMFARKFFRHNRSIINDIPVNCKRHKSK